jgi:hypothetical protein
MMHHKTEPELRLFSGRKVKLEVFHMQTLDLGWLFGTPELIRRDVLKKMHNQVSPLFGNSGVLMREPPPGPLPLFTCIAALESAPLQAEAHVSSLGVCCFTDSLPNDLRSHIVSHIEDVDWDRFAKDGMY